jgi:hypothetical protein
MDMFFQIETPLLDDQTELTIRNKFLSYSDQPVPLPIAYNILFNDRKELGYDYELFLEDLTNLTLQQSGSMSFEEAMRFIQLMQ